MWTPFLSPNQRPYFNLDNDVAHEDDFESEDMDFYPETEKMQHYKKLGWIWIWAVVGMTFFITMWWEMIFNHFPDAEYFKKPLPPPLDHPDPFSTPDTAVFKSKQENGWKMRRDAGLHADPMMDIIDGKKVYSRFAPVNKPMELI